VKGVKTGRDERDEELKAKEGEKRERKMKKRKVLPYHFQVLLPIVVMRQSNARVKEMHCTG